MRHFFHWATPFVPTLAFLALAGAEEPATSTIKIPLKEIWGYQLPGTRNIRELQDIPPLPPGKELFERSHIARIILKLGSKIPEEPEPGFAVSGVDLDALREMREVLTKERESQATLPADKNVTLAFFSYNLASDVQLIGVSRADRVITIKYRFITHTTLDSTTHFALIPLGTVPSGVYDVKVEQLPLRACFEIAVMSEKSYGSAFLDSQVKEAGAAAWKARGSIPAI